MVYSFFFSKVRSCSITALLLVFFIVHFSKESLAQGFKGGVAVGFTSSQIDGDMWGGYNFWGYQLGGFVYYNFSDRLALQIEIGNSLRGSREAGVGRIALRYIDLPVLLIYRKKISTGQINGEFGLSGNVLLSAKSGLVPFTVDNTEAFRRFSSELHVGATYYFIERAGIFARWSVGLSNLQSNPRLRPWLTIHNFTVGMRLRLK